MKRHKLLIVAALLACVNTQSAVLGAQTGWAPVNRRGPTNANFVNLNSAELDAIAQLPGITESEAKAILNGRPYKAKRELVRRKILTAEKYAKIRSRITVLPPAPR
jgi:competence protein ComEA